MNRTILNKATSPDGTATPGYLFDEIAKVTHDPLANDRLIEYLLRRLESPSANVKAKVLNIIKHVCRKGNPAFRRAWQRESAVIKAHLQFHGPADPLRGDEPSKRVREGAKEALEAVFDSGRDERADPAVSGRIQGFGGVMEPQVESTQAIGSFAGASTGFSSASPSFSSGMEGRYGGIGNPNFQDPRNQQKTFIERVTDAVREKVDKPVEAIPGVGGVKPPWMTQGVAGANGTAGGYAYASNRGGGAYDPRAGGAGYDPMAGQRRVEQVWSDPRSPRPVAGASPAYGNGMAAAAVAAVPARQMRRSEKSDGTREHALVSELCAAGGVRPIPPKDKLDAFVKSCRTLDAESVIGALNDKLQEDDSKTQLKALCVLDAILQVPQLDSYGDCLDSAPENLENLYQSKNSLVREKAQHVWKLLYDDIQGSPPSSGANDGGVAAAAASFMSDSNSFLTPAREVNLLDFDTGATAIPSHMPSMFENMNVKNAPVLPPFSASPVAAPAITTAPVMNMFESMKVSSPAMPAQTTSSMPASSSFSFISSQPAVSPAVQPKTTGNGLLPFDVPSSSLKGSATDFFSSAPTPAFATTAFPPTIRFSNSGASNFGSSSFGASSSFGSSPPMAAAQYPPPMANAVPVAKPTMGRAQPAPSKKTDSFNFVQDALQSTKKT